MKSLHLFFHRIGQYFCRNKSIFVLFLIGGVVNSMVCAYLYGNLPSISSRNSREIRYREYQVYYEQTQSLEDSDSVIENLKASPLLEDVFIAHQYGQDSHGFPIYVCAAIRGTFGLVRTKGTLEFYDSKQVIVPYDCKMALGEKIHILGQGFTIIGQHTGSDYFIGKDDFYSCGGNLDKLHIISKERHYSANDQVEKFLAELCPGASIDTPKIHEYQDKAWTGNGLWTIGLICVASVVSFLSLLRYLIDSLANENSVSIIVGASSGMIATTIFWESLTLFAVSNVAGLLCYGLLYDCFFSKFGAAENLVYTKGDYLAVFLLMFVATVIAVIPHAFKYRKLSPIQTRWLQK